MSAVMTGAVLVALLVLTLGVSTSGRGKRSVPLWAVVLAVPISVIALVVVGVLKASSEPTVETVLRGLQHNLDQIETLQGTVSSWPAGFKGEARHRSRLWHFAMGPTGCREEEMPPGLEEGVPETIYAFDGENVYSWSFPSNVGGIGRSLDQVGRPDFVLSRLSLFGRFDPAVPSASEEIARLEGLRLAGTEVLGQVSCYRLEGRLHETEEVYWVAPDRGFQVKRHDWTYAGRDPAATGVVRVRWSHLVEEFTEFEGGIWLPTRVVELSVHIRADGTEKPSAKHTFEVLNLTVNEPVDEGLFRLQFALSTSVAEEGVAVDHPVPGEFGIGKG